MAKKPRTQTESIEKSVVRREVDELPEWQPSPPARPPTIVLRFVRPRECTEHFCATYAARAFLALVLGGRPFVWKGNVLKSLDGKILMESIQLDTVMNAKLSVAEMDWSPPEPLWSRGMELCGEVEE